MGSGGLMVSYNDVAAGYASFTFGISNCIAESTGVIIPYLVSIMTKNVKKFNLSCFYSY